MKRVLCGLALGAVAFSAVPAHATEYPAGGRLDNDGHRTGVYTWYGDPDDPTPLGGAWVNHDTGQVCVGFSYQIPQCAGGPIS